MSNAATIWLQPPQQMQPPQPQQPHQQLTSNNKRTAHAAQVADNLSRQMFSRAPNVEGPSEALWGEADGVLCGAPEYYHGPQHESPQFHHIDGVKVSSTKSIKLNHRSRKEDLASSHQQHLHHKQLLYQYNNNIHNYKNITHNSSQQSVTNDDNNMLPATTTSQLLEPNSIVKKRMLTNSSTHQQQQQESIDSKYLVRTLSDLPVFITVEGYRIASHNIAGEPYLCLPQLLQHLKQSFPLDNVVRIFEETVDTFTSATPKQVEGFIKTSALPPNVESCPLIKRSDADRICLRLFEQCSKTTKWNDIVNLCTTSKVALSKDNTGRNKNEEDDAQQRPVLAKNPSPSLNPSPNLNLSPNSSPSQRTTTQNKSLLFDSEAQEVILGLAKAVSSTLMIQVYHRCYGKCIGLFYPSLLKDSESECIECSACHIMLSPRRFTGHAHSSELNVCHWGFNSYNWRAYIRLSRKQRMNNLDEDELLVKFSQLQLAPDSEQDRLATAANNELSLATTTSSSALDLGRELIQAATEPIRDREGEEECLKKTGVAKEVGLENYGCNMTRLDLLRSLNEAGGTLCSLASTLSLAAHSMTTTSPLSTTAASAVPPLTSTIYRGMGNFVGDQILVSPPNQTVNFCTTTPTRALTREVSGQPLFDSGLISVSEAVAASAAERPPTITNAELNREARREAYVAGSLAVYLNSKGFDAENSRDMIDNIIAIVHKSRILL